MLITDGVPYNFEEIFREFNWPDQDFMGKRPQPVRVFTYLVGREVSFFYHFFPDFAIKKSTAVVETRRYLNLNSDVWPLDRTLWHIK